MRHRRSGRTRERGKGRDYFVNGISLFTEEMEMDLPRK